MRYKRLKLDSHLENHSYRYLQQVAEEMLKTKRVGADVTTGGATTGLAETGMVIAGNMFGLFLFFMRN